MAMLTRAEARTHPSAQSPVSNDICPNNGDKADRKHKERNVNVDNDNENDNDDNGLFQEAIDEHYVCDIAMMRIGEEVAAQNRDAMPSAVHNGDELEIDRQEEEQTISDLVRASSTGALMES